MCEWNKFHTSRRIKRRRDKLYVCMRKELLSFDVKRWQSLRVFRFASDKVFVIFMQFIVVWCRIVVVPFLMLSLWRVHRFLSVFFIAKHMQKWHFCFYFEQCAYSMLLPKNVLAFWLFPPLLLNSKIFSPKISAIHNFSMPFTISQKLFAVSFSLFLWDASNKDGFFVLIFYVALFRYFHLLTWLQVKSANYCIESRANTKQRFTLKLLFKMSQRRHQMLYMHALNINAEIDTQTHISISIIVLDEISSPNSLCNFYRLCRRQSNRTLKSHSLLAHFVNNYYRC